MLSKIKPTPAKIKSLLSEHNEIIIIYVDPVVDTNETSIGAFVKILDKDGKLARLLEDILANLKATHDKKRGITNQTTIGAKESRN